MNGLRLCAAVLLTAVLSTGCRTTPTPPQGEYAERMAHDLRAGSSAFHDGSLSGRAYLALSIDRAGKLRRFHADAAWRDAAASGDRDRDGVPDRFDRCDTPALQATDESGCPLSGSDLCADDMSDCGPGVRDDARVRDLASAVELMFDPECDAATVPQVPSPLEWGRGDQPRLGTAGYNMALVRVDNQPPGCEVFYEIEVRYENPSTQQVEYANVLFRASEDFSDTEPARVVFGIPAGTVDTAAPQRERLRTIFGTARPVRWRARAVNGAQRASPWSAIREQGPASAGVWG